VIVQVIHTTRSFRFLSVQSALRGSGVSEVGVSAGLDRRKAVACYVAEAGQCLGLPGGPGSFRRLAGEAGDVRDRATSEGPKRVEPGRFPVQGGGPGKELRTVQGAQIERCRGQEGTCLPGDVRSRPVP
jgi:hypothetical protein